MRRALQSNACRFSQRSFSTQKNSFFEKFSANWSTAYSESGSTSLQREAEFRTEYSPFTYNKKALYLVSNRNDPTPTEAKWFAEEVQEGFNFVGYQSPDTPLADSGWQPPCTKIDEVISNGKEPLSFPQIIEAFKASNYFGSERRELAELKEPPITNALSKLTSYPVSTKAAALSSLQFISLASYTCMIQSSFGGSFDPTNVILPLAGAMIMLIPNYLLWTGTDSLISNGLSSDPVMAYRDKKIASDIQALVEEAPDKANVIACVDPKRFSNIKSALFNKGFEEIEQSSNSVKP